MGDVVTPYYAEGGVTIYHGDALEVLPTLERNSVDLLVTDPPWGVGFVGRAKVEVHGRIVGDENESVAHEVLAASCRVLRPFRHAYVFGPETLIRPPLAASAQLIWDKVIVSGGDCSLPWSKNWEPITFAMNVPTESARERGSGRLSARLRKGAVIRCQRTNGQATKYHPTQKPVEVLRQLIESSSILGEWVLDPFMGVGSTLVAAIAEERRSIGIEVEEKYCERAAERCRAATDARAQGVLMLGGDA